MRTPGLRSGLLAAVLVTLFWATAIRAEEAMPAYRVQVDGLACPFCAYGIEKRLSAVEGVQSVETDIRSGTVTVTMAPGSTLHEDAARRAVEAAGFTMRGFKRQEASE